MSSCVRATEAVGDGDGVLLALGLLVSIGLGGPGVWPNRTAVSEIKMLVITARFNIAIYC
jgi:hypothetical protein